MPPRATTEGRIYLTGFMAAGKTAIGSALAKNLGYRFIDLDRAIEAEQGETVSEIFERHGEARFRELEHECLLRTADVPNAVIATGGGTMTFSRNREVIRRAGLCVWLDPGLETILERLRKRGAASPGFGAGRPMARDEEQTRALYHSRLDAYRMADLGIELAPEDTAPHEDAHHVAGRIALLLRERRCVI